MGLNFFLLLYCVQIKIRPKDSLKEFVKKTRSVLRCIVLYFFFVIVLCSKNNSSKKIVKKKKFIAFYFFFVIVLYCVHGTKIFVEKIHKKNSLKKTEFYCVVL